MIQHLNKIRSRFSVIGFPQTNQSFPRMRKSPLYIDKSELIDKIINKGLYAPLITRPRRWGKSLNLDMLTYFFQPNGWPKALGQKFDICNGNEYRHLFVGNEQYRPLKIANYKDIIEKYQGQNPVVVLNFANLYFQDKQEFNEKMKELIHQAYLQHKYIYLKIQINLIQRTMEDCWKNKLLKQIWEDKEWIVQNKLNLDKMLADHDPENIHLLIESLDEVIFDKVNTFQFVTKREQYLASCFKGELNDNHLINFQTLIEELYRYFNRRVIILIDEFDTTTVQLIKNEIDQYITSGNVSSQLRKDYTQQMRLFMLQILKYPLYDKIQNCVIFAISDIFPLSDSSLNNISYCPITSAKLSDCFAFTKSQVSELVERFVELMKNDFTINIDHEKSQIRQNIDEWYNGYNLDNQQMYCPYSVMEYLSLIYQLYPHSKKLPQPQPFWTSSGANILLMNLGELNLEKYLLQSLENLIETGIIKFPTSLDIKSYPNDVREFFKDYAFLKFILVNTGYITPVEGMENTYKVPNKEVQHALLPYLMLIKLQKHLRMQNEGSATNLTTKLFESFEKADEFQQVLEEEVFPLLKLSYIKERTFQDLIGSFFPIFSLQIVQGQHCLAAVSEYSGLNQKKIDHYFQPKDKTHPIILHEYKLAKSISQVEKLIVEGIWQIYGKCYLDSIVKEQGLAGENRNDKILARVLVFYQNSSQEWKVSIVQFNHTLEQAQQVNNLFMKSYYPLSQNQQPYDVNNQEQVNQQSQNNEKKRKNSSKQESLEVQFLKQNNASSIFELISKFGNMSGSSQNN